MSPTVHFITQVMSLGAIGMQVIVVLLVLSLFLKKEEIRQRKGLGAFVAWVSDHVLQLGFVVSLLAMLGSLFFSNIVGFAPCDLCWWARILMYPQTIMFAVAWYYKRKGVPDSIATTTSLILASLGILLNAFQYYGVMFNPSILEACVAQGVSCAKNYFTAFGYITIPMMSLTCFALLLMIIITHKRVVKIQNS